MDLNLLAHLVHDVNGLHLFITTWSWVVQNQSDLLVQKYQLLNGPCESIILHKVRRNKPVNEAKEKKKK